MYVFNIKFEFSKKVIFDTIFLCVKESMAKYVCVVDGNVLANVQQNISYRTIINNSLLNICDGSSIALFTNWIYGTHYSAFTGPMIFKELLYKNYKQLLLGNTTEILNLLKTKIQNDGYKISNYSFMSLPFREVEDFDYQSIADYINENSFDLIWVSLGAPKQEIFVSKLTPFLNRGVVFAIGAAFNLILDEKNESPFSIYLKRIYLGWVLRVISEPRRIGGRAWRYFKLIPKMIYLEIKKKNNKIGL